MKPLNGSNGSLTRLEHGEESTMHCPDVPGLVQTVACPSVLLARRSQLDLRLPVEGETTQSQTSPRVLAGLVG